MTKENFIRRTAKVTIEDYVKLLIGVRSSQGIRINIRRNCEWIFDGMLAGCHVNRLFD